MVDGIVEAGEAAAPERTRLVGAFTAPVLKDWLFWLCVALAVGEFAARPYDGPRPESTIAFVGLLAANLALWAVKSWLLVSLTIGSVRALIIGYREGRLPGQARSSKAGTDTGG